MQPVLPTVTAQLAENLTLSLVVESVPTVHILVAPVMELELVLLVSVVSTTSKAPAELLVLMEHDLLAEFADVTQALFLSVSASLVAEQVSLLSKAVVNLAILTVLSVQET